MSPSTIMLVYRIAYTFFLQTYIFPRGKHMHFAFKVKQKLGVMLTLCLLISSNAPLCASNPTQASQQTQIQDNIYPQLANLYLKSFEAFKEPTVTEKTLEDVLQNNEKTLSPKKELNEYEKRHLIFNILAQHSHYKNNTMGSAIDKSFLSKMEILSGGEHTGNSLFSKINHTKTIFGEIVLARWLAQPLTDSKELQQRQALIKALATDPQLFNELEAALLQIKNSENSLLAYWQKLTPPDHIKNQYFGSWFSSLNKNSTALEASTRLSQAWTAGDLLGITALPMATLSSALWIYMGSKAITGKAISARQALSAGWSEATAMNMVQLNPFKLKEVFEYIDQNAHEINISPKAGKIAFSIFYTTNMIGRIYGTKWTIEREIAKRNCTNDLQQQLIHVANYIDGMKKIYTAIKHRDLDNNIAGIDSLAQLNQHSPTHSSNFNTLIALLDTATFSGDPSFFSKSGRILAAHTLLQEVKDELIEALEITGELDACMSTAKLYTKVATPRIPTICYSFAHYKTNADSAYVNAAAFWNPFVDENVVVANNIRMGHDSSHPNNAIITGPNTGGKSTVIKGLLLSIFLAQTLTIAPAQELVLTPFAKLNCHVNVTEDVSAGASLFKAEVLRAKNLLNTLKTLDKKQFSFTIMDEAFSSTSPKEGEEAAYMFAQQLGAYNNSMLMLATHFPRLTELEEKAQPFKNYQVTVIKQEDGSLVRPFTLEEGKSLVNIAMDLLREEGVL